MRASLRMYGVKRESRRRAKRPAIRWTQRAGALFPALVESSEPRDARKSTTGRIGATATASGAHLRPMGDPRRLERQRWGRRFRAPLRASRSSAARRPPGTTRRSGRLARADVRFRRGMQACRALTSVLLPVVLDSSLISVHADACFHAQSSSAATTCRTADAMRWRQRGRAPMGAR